MQSLVHVDHPAAAAATLDAEELGVFHIKGRPRVERDDSAVISVVVGNEVLDENVPERERTVDVPATTGGAVNGVVASRVVTCDIEQSHPTVLNS